MHGMLCSAADFLVLGAGRNKALGNMVLTDLVNLQPTTFYEENYTCTNFTLKYFAFCERIQFIVINKLHYNRFSSEI